MHTHSKTQKTVLISLTILKLKIFRWQMTLRTKWKYKQQKTFALCILYERLISRLFKETSINQLEKDK